MIQPDARRPGDVENLSSQAGHRPDQLPKLQASRDDAGGRVQRLELRPHLHRAPLKDLPLPHLPPALRGVAEHRDGVAVRERRALHHALLRLARVPPEDHRVARRREQPRERARDVELLLLREEVEEHRRVDRGEAARKRGERREGGEVGCAGGRRLCWRREREEGRV